MYTTPANPARAKAPKPAHVQQGVMHGTPATRQIHALAMGGSTGPRTTKRKKKAAKPASGTRKKSARSATAARSAKGSLVKGSAAAKKRMAQLRAMVGKKKKAA